MALMTLSGSPFQGIETAQNSVAGITHITQASIEKSAGTVVRAKNGAGDVKAVLTGKEVITMSVSGYSTDGQGAVLGTNIKVANTEGKVVSASIEATAEDFIRFSAEGRALSPTRSSLS
jgi:hypothetical protein